jgi:phenylacetate-CoA ligase
MRYLDPESFQKIVRHARQTHPFYARWIPPGGPVPILTRQVLQENNDEILNGHRETARTSGSTGTPVRVHMSADRAALDTKAVAFFIRHMGGPLPRTEFIHPRGPYDPETLVPVLTPVEEQLNILRQAHAERQATALITYPSNAVLLAQAILDRGLDFSFIQRVGMLSEAIDPGQTALIQRAFPKARQWSSYSSMELGLIAFQCPYHPEYHHAATRKLGIEILDDAGRDCEPGQLGRLVITDYFNTEMPLIRYEIGDLAAFATCPCGKIGLPALQQILGKVRGCLLHRDGRRIPFIDLSVALRDLPGMRQYQVIQEEVERFTVKVAASTDLGGEIRSVFTGEFGYTPQIDIETVESIPRDPNGKFYASICRV